MATLNLLAGNKYTLQVGSTPDNLVVVGSTEGPARKGIVGGKIIIEENHGKGIVGGSILVPEETVARLGGRRLINVGGKIYQAGTTERLVNIGGKVFYEYAQATGTDAGAYTLTADVHAYTSTYPDVTLTYTSAGHDDLVADVHAYTSTFTATGLQVTRQLPAAVHTYTSTFTDTGLTATRSFTAEVHAYSSTFTDTGLIAARSFAADVHAYTSTFYAAGLEYSGGDAVLTADVHTYTSTFTDTGLTATRTLTADVHAYTSTFQDANLPKGYTLAADVSASTSTFHDIVLKAAHVLTADVHAYTSTFPDVTLTKAAPGALRTSCILVLRTGTIRPNLSALSWAWFDAEDPVNFIAPTDQGQVETTDGTGLIEVELPNTTLTAGQSGSLVVRADDGSAYGIYNLEVASGS